jgi:PadR family transcriptional regulator, regulatory protein PadR
LPLQPVLCFVVAGPARSWALDGSGHLTYTVGQMSGIGSVGQFEQMVLAAILSLRDNAYGVTIHGKVAELAQPKRVSLGAVYVTLDRLEDKGFVSSWLTDPTAERGGRAKRCYRLEALGEQALQESAATAMRVSEAIQKVLGRDWARKWKKEWKKEAG